MSRPYINPETLERIYDMSRIRTQGSDNWTPPYRPSPGRREFIHGRINGLPDVDRSGPVFVTLALIIAAYFILQLARGVL